MAAIKSLENGTLESLANILGNTDHGLTGTEITRYLAESNIPDALSYTSKRDRLYKALIQKQNIDHCSNNIFAFLQTVLHPARNIKHPDWHKETIQEINQVLIFEGFKIGENGKITTTQKVETHTEAFLRASQLKSSLIARKVHADVLIYSKEELLVDNYFHAVFEATKSVADKIRNKTGLTSDGSELVDQAFAFKETIPHIALNSLTSESEKSEQRGFQNLLKGVFGTFRNTTAHAPKITWKIEEQDALDILSLVSLIHRRLDNAILAKKIYEGRG